MHAVTNKENLDFETNHSQSVIKLIFDILS